MGSRNCLEYNVLCRGNFSSRNAAGEGLPVALVLPSSTLKCLSSLLLLSHHPLVGSAGMETGRVAAGRGGIVEWNSDIFVLD